MKRKNQTQKSFKNLQKLSLSIGDFIRYWGFRRIHGAIWTQLYLSKTPLSCTDLTVRLDLSKALVSPALEELCQYNLITEAPAPNEKTKVYEACKNINEVILHVLKTREAKILDQINNDFSALTETENESAAIDGTKLKSLGKMIISANLMLEIMLAQKDILNLPFELEK